MADVSTDPPLRGRLQGLLLAQDLQVWDGAGSGASYTEQSPIPGLPAADRDSHLVIAPGGVPTGTANLEVRAQHGGLPGQVDHGATVAVRRTGDTLWLGSEQPGVLSGWEQPQFAPVSIQSDPDIAVTSNGTLVLAVRAGVEIRVLTKAPAATTWTDRGIISSPVAWLYYPALVVIGDDIYCLAWRTAYSWSSSVGDADRAFYVGIWRSTDHGATWGLVQDAATIEDDVRREDIVAIGAGTVYSLGRIRAAYRDGEVIVLAHLRAQALNNDLDFVRHWAGPGLTTRLDLLETIQIGTGAVVGIAKPDVVATPDGFAVAMWARDRQPLFCLLGSAWQPLASASPTAIAVPFDILAGGGWTAVGAGTARTLEPDDIGECALAYDPAGVLWLYTACTATSIGAGNQFAYYTRDGGTTWTPGHGSFPATSDISGYWWYPTDTGVAPPGTPNGTQGNYPTEYAAVWYRGLVAIAHSWLATVADSDRRAGVAYLGGWSDLTLPRERDGILIGHRVGWLRTVLPFERPDDQDYGLVSAGTFTSALAAPGVHAITTGDGVGGNGQVYYGYTGVDNGSMQHGGLEWQLAVAASEGTGTTVVIGGRMRLAGLGHGVEVEIIQTSTGIYVRDLVAGTALGSVTGLTPGAAYQTRMGMALESETGANRAVQVWYRAATPGEREKRRWSRIGQWALADDAGAGGIVPSFQWGHPVHSGGVTQNQSEWVGPWFFLPYAASGSVVGTDGLWHDLDQAGGDNPTKLPGRPLGSAQAWSMDGITLAGRRGPGLIGDSWIVKVRGEYEVDRAFSRTVPSPRIHLRTVDTTTDPVIPWAVDPSQAGVEDAEHPPLLALHVVTNARQCVLQSKAAAGAWTSRAIIDMRVLAGVGYARTGRTLQSSGAASTVYLLRDEVDADWTVEWDDGAGTTAYRHLVGNSEGRFASSVAEPQARLELASTLATDPTGGGTLSLWSPRATVIVPAQTCTAWRVVVQSAFPTADGDFRIKLFWGPFFPFAFPPSWSRGITQLPGHRRTELEGDVGVAVTRSPVARELRLAWDAGVDESQIHLADVVRSITGSTGGVEPAAAVAALPGSLVGALRRHQGNPVVWAAWDRAGPGPVIILRGHEQLLGTIEAPPDIEVVIGEVGTTEQQRLATLLCREER